MQNRSCTLQVCTGSLWNFIDDHVFASLPYQPPLRQRDISVVAGNGEAVTIRGFVVLPVTICGMLFWHEFAVVHELAVNAIIGADILRRHECALRYGENGQMRLEIMESDCEECRRNRALPLDGAAASDALCRPNESRLEDSKPQRRRLRRKCFRRKTTGKLRRRLQRICTLRRGVEKSASRLRVKYSGTWAKLRRNLSRNLHCILQ